jgi:hypothetical protein
MSETGYSDAERAALAALLDTIVPPSDDGRLPGAGALGLGEQIEREVPALAPYVRSAIARLDEIAGGAGAFTAQAPDARGATLRVLTERDPWFLPGFLFQAYPRYYTDARVVAALGMEPRPPYPKGYAMEPSDLDGLLAPVRAGPQRYRDA